MTDPKTMSSTPFSLIFLPVFLSLLFSHTLAQTPSPSSPPTGPINITDILAKGGQYTILLRLLNQTRLIEQLTSQLNNTPQGLTIFSPTDSAFNNLKAGVLNGLSDQQQIQLLLYHVLPQFYTLTQLLTVSNPVRTQATGSDGVWGLNFTGQANQVNVSTGVVSVPIHNALRQQAPLGVYEVDQVLLPEELFGNKTVTPAAPAPKSATTGHGNKTTGGAAPASTDDGTGAGVRSTGVGIGLVWGLGLISIGFIW